MKPFPFVLFLFVIFGGTARSQEQPLFFLYGTQLVNDSSELTFSFDPAVYKPFAYLASLSQQKGPRKMVLHTTKNGQEVVAYFFPGTSDKKAIVLGGMHGSELSSIDVAQALIGKLSAGEKQYYNTVVVPSVFPDNAQLALRNIQTHMTENWGRYSTEKTADPNRQMPMLGKPYVADQPFDALNREIEAENKALLELIQVFAPHRIISIHAIKDRSKAGVFADPRTDCHGTALGFTSDEGLALLMAQHIESLGGACPGNNLAMHPTAHYYLDPPVAEEGQRQERSFDGSKATGRAKGVSLGSWCSTAVCATEDKESRKAIRTFTMEFPGYQRPSEYKKAEDRRLFEKMVQVHASSIQQVFLQPYLVEEALPDNKLLR